MKKEVESINHEAIKQALFLFLLTLLSLLAVHFPVSDKGSYLMDDGDLKRLSPPERRLAKKLKSLGLRPTFEILQVQLDQGVRIAQYERSGRQKTKSLTTPDFYVRIGDIDCFMEVGSNLTDGHKKDQRKVMQAAIANENAKNVLYAQLIGSHIKEIEEQVHSPEELLTYLYGLSHSVYVPR